MNDYNAYIIYIFTLVAYVLPIALTVFFQCYSLTVQGLSTERMEERRKMRSVRVRFSVALILFVVIFFLVLTHPVYENIKFLWSVDGVVNNFMVFLWFVLLAQPVCLTSCLVLKNLPGDD